MKRALSFISMLIILSSCAPVLNRELMNQGLRDVPLSAVRENPEAYKGKLFILGGIIVDTKLTEKGSQIEAFAVPVSGLGYLKEEARTSDGRFLAIYPRDHGFLEPLVFKRGRQITLAGEFLETRKLKIDEVEYTYPVFEIEQIYLWDEYRDYYYPPYYYPYPYGWYYDPWWPNYPPYWYRPYGPPPGWW